MRMPRIPEPGTVKGKTSLGQVIAKRSYCGPFAMLLWFQNRCFYVLQIACGGWGLFEFFGGVVWG